MTDQVERVAEAIARRAGNITLKARECMRWPNDWTAYEQDVTREQAAVAIAAMDQWLPIETAPRDGDCFLAINYHTVARTVEDHVVDRYHPFICRSTPVPEGSKKWANGAGFMEPGRDWPSYPTHWRPLPDPPETQP